jgi:O-antigen/teichoic acid export membrane protein
MGAERYGAVTLAVAVVGALSFIDFGLGWSALRFIPRLHARTSGPAADTAASLLVTSAVVAGSAIAVVGAAIALPLVALGWLRWGSPRDSTAFVVLILLLVAVTLISNTLMSVARALGDFSVATVVSTGYFVTTNIVWVVVAGHPHDVQLVIAWQVLFVLLSVPFWIRRVRTLGLQDLRTVSPRQIPRLPSERRAIMSFAGFSALVGISSSIFTGADRLAVAAGAGVADLPSYSIPASLCVRLAIVASSLTAVVFPRLAAAATDDTENYQVLSRWALSAAAIPTAAAAAVLVWAGDDFMAIWITPEFARETTTAVSALALGFAVYAIGQLGYAANDALGRVRRSMVSGIAFSTTGLIGAFLAARVSGVPLAAVVFASALLLHGATGLVLGFGARRVRLVRAIEFAGPSFVVVGLAAVGARAIDAPSGVVFAIAVAAGGLVISVQGWQLIRQYRQ